MSSWYQEFVYFAAASETISVQVDIKILDFVYFSHNFLEDKLLVECKKDLPLKSDLTMGKICRLVLHSSLYLNSGMSI